LAKTGGILLGAIYVCGFVIVTLHHARFGISQFDVLRPRIIAAGVSFMLLTAVPALISLRFFGALGLTHTHVSSAAGTKNLMRLRFLHGAYIYPISFGIAAGFAGLMPLFPSDNPTNGYLCPRSWLCPFVWRYFLRFGADSTTRQERGPPLQSQFALAFLLLSPVMLFGCTFCSVSGSLESVLPLSSCSECFDGSRWMPLESSSGYISYQHC
jgi:hypothetical protein